MTQAELIAKIVEEYRKRDLLFKASDGRELLSHPTTLAAEDIFVYDEAGKGALGEEAYARELERWREKAIKSGLPESSARANDFGDRLFMFTASDETRDRYGDRILVTGRLGRKKYGEGWKIEEYTKNPVFMAHHFYAAIPIGNAVDTWTDVKAGRKRLRQAVLMDEGDANPVAPLFAKAYRKRVMRAVSVGFMPITVYKPASDEERSELGLGEFGYLFATQELWENSAVAIPANPAALLEDSVERERYMSSVRDVEELAREIEDAGDSAAKELAYAMRSALPKSRSIVLPAGLCFSDESSARAYAREARLVIDKSSIADEGFFVIERWHARSGSDEPEEIVGKELRDVRLAIAARAVEVQSLVFPKAHWPELADAKAWAKEHGFKSTKVDETDDAWRLRQAEPDAFDADSFRTICMVPEDAAPSSDACEVKAVIGSRKDAESPAQDMDEKGTEEDGPTVEALSERVAELSVGFDELSSRVEGIETTLGITKAEDEDEESDDDDEEDEDEEESDDDESKASKSKQEEVDEVYKGVMELYGDTVFADDVDDPK